MKTGLMRTSGPRFQGSSAEGATRRQETSPRSVSSMATKIETAWRTTAASPTATPVIHSEPVVPKVEAATRLRRRPAVQPHEGRNRVQESVAGDGGQHGRGGQPAQAGITQDQGPGRVQEGNPDEQARERRPDRPDPAPPHQRGSGQVGAEDGRKVGRLGKRSMGEEALTCGQDPEAGNLVCGRRSGGAGSAGKAIRLTAGGPIDRDQESYHIRKGGSSAWQESQAEGGSEHRRFGARSRRRPAQAR